VHEESGGAGARERRRELAADVTRFAHAQHDDAAGTRQHVARGLGEGVIDAVHESGERPRFDLDDGPSESLDPVDIERRQRRCAGFGSGHGAGQWLAVAGVCLEWAQGLQVRGAIPPV